MNPNYLKLVDDIYNGGTIVESRLGPSRELMGTQVSLYAGEMVSRPKFNKALGWMELLQLVAGVFDVEQVKRVAPSVIAEYFSGASAYGPRAYSALNENSYYSSNPNADMNSDKSMYDYGPANDNEYIIRVLREVKRTPNTRRAVLFIGKSWDTPDELACTLTYQFLARGGGLHAIVSMRSWDVIRGLPYDIIMFGGLLQAAAHVLGYKAGNVIITAGSLHLYESDLDMRPVTDKFSSFKLNFPDDALWSGIRTTCKNQVYQDWGEEKTPHFIKMMPWTENK